MAVKRATTTRRPASSAAAGKPAKGRSAKSSSTKGRPAVKAAQPRAKGKAAVKTVAARPAAKKKAAAGVRRAAAKPAKPQAKLVSGADRVVQVVEGALDEMKAVQIKVLDVRQLTDFADTLVIASGNSDRHVRSIAERVVEHAKKAGLRAMGIEGLRDGEWVLVDLQDVIVHVMLPRIRELYRLEDLWDVSAARREAASEKMAV